VKLTLKGLAADAGAAVDGVAAAKASNGVAALALGAGQHVVSVGPVASGGAPRLRRTAVLPLQLAATGVPASAIFAVGITLLLVALALRRASRPLSL
jgi:hypothetical protein